MANERNPLEKVILADLFSQNKIALLLLLAVVASAFVTVLLTHETRELTAQKGQLEERNQDLENYYIHLQIEENTLVRQKHENGVAGRLGLQAVKKEQEVMLVK